MGCEIGKLYETHGNKFCQVGLNFKRCCEGDCPHWQPDVSANDKISGTDEIWACMPFGGDVPGYTRDPQSRYYNSGGIEVQDIIKAKLTTEQYEGFCIGNAIKYLTRANFKGDKRRDVEKARYYVEWLYDAIIENEELETEGE